MKGPMLTGHWSQRLCEIVFDKRVIVIISLSMKHETTNKSLPCLIDYVIILRHKIDVYIASFAVQIALDNGQIHLRQLLSAK